MSEAKLSHEVILNKFQGLLKRKEKVRFEIGDIIREQGITPDELEVYAKELDVEVSTLQRYYAVAAAFKPESGVRDLEVSWGILEQLAKLKGLNGDTDDSRRALLDSRPLGEWTIASMRTSVYSLQEDQRLARLNERRARKGEPPLTKREKPSDKPERAGCNIRGHKLTAEYKDGWITIKLDTALIDVEKVDLRAGSTTLVGKLPVVSLDEEDV